MQPILPIDVGDCMPDFRLLDVKRLVTSLYTLAVGRPIVVLLYPSHRAAVVRDVLRGFVASERRIAECADVFSISGDSHEENARFAGETKLPFPLLSDPERKIVSFFGRRRRALGGTPWPEDGAPVCVVTDSNRRIMRIDPDVRDPGHVETVLAFLDAQPREEARAVGPHAPVLVVPQVLDRAYCDRLIKAYEESDRPLSDIISGQRGNTDPVADRSFKVRRDLFLSETDFPKELGVLFGKRVLPEMMKAFDFKATRYEKMRIGCYDAGDGGFFKPHRDNVDPEGGRRFAMSMNLNAGDFEGGALCFPEYGPHLYMTGSGDALVYSSLLVHEVTPVTAGRRYALVTFFIV